MRKIAHLMGVVYVSLIFQPSAYAQDACLECHGEKDLTKTAESGAELSLYVDHAKYQNSAHGEFACTDCHADAEGDPHPEMLEHVDCGVCHDDASAEFAEGMHGKALAAGDPEAPGCADCHGKHDILNSSDPKSSTNVVNLPTACGKCHNVAGVSETHKSIVIKEPAAAFEKGIHGRALLDGNDAAASCSNCHGSHRLLPMSDPLSPIHHQNVSQTCGQCHSDVAEEFEMSSHGVALANGVSEAPTCNSCHGEHEIQSPSDPASPTSAGHLAEETCSPCHGFLKLNKKYGLLADPVTSYKNSYHGLASVGGSKVAANCISCHGAHDILSHLDPRSSIHVSNLKETCGKCHVNVTDAFVQSYVHTSPTSLADKLSDIIKKLYIYLIVAVIGGMVVHNFIIYLSYVRAKYRALKMMDTVQRFDKKWIVQHLLIFISFTVLVITGFALKFANSGWAQLLNTIGFTESIRSITHRVAAVVMLVTSVYHVFYLFFARSAKGEVRALLPGFRDVQQFILNMKYHLGMTREKPQFERYGYIEKAEYWALVWGTVIMAITGFVLWFPTAATSYLPAWIVKVSETIHYYEAWLATLAILLYHMFFAIFHPADYPINLTSLTGKISKDEAEERFPAWYRKVESAEKKGDDKDRSIHEGFSKRK